MRLDCAITAVSHEAQLDILPANPAAMRKALSRFLLQPAGWMSLAFLGYWFALLVQFVFLQMTLFPLAGARILSWRTSPFFVSLQSTPLSSAKPAYAWLQASPLLFALAVLVALLLWGNRFRRPFLRAGCGFAGLWIALWLAADIVQFSSSSDSALSWLLRLLTKPRPETRIAHWATIAIAALVLLPSGVIFARRLITEMRSGWLSNGKTNRLATLLVALLIALPMELITWAAFGRALRWLELREILTLLIMPGALSIGLAFVGLLFKFRPVSRPGFTAANAAAAIGLALLWCASLWALPRARIWWHDRAMSRLTFAHHDIRYNPKQFPPGVILAVAAEREKNLISDAARIEFSGELPRFQVYLYGDFPSEREATGSHFPYSVRGTRIRAVLAGSVQQIDPAADAEALLRSAWGAPGTPLVGDWVARWLAGEWRGRSIDAWAAQMETELGHHTAQELLEDSPDGELSPLVRTPLGAAFIGWVHERFGLAGVRRIYDARQSQLNPDSLVNVLNIPAYSFENEWGDWCARLQAKFPPARVARRPMPPDFFFRGISFADALSVHGGYASPAAAQEIRRLRDMGANAIALVPYGLVGKDSTRISYMRTGENDEGVTEAAFAVHQLGMKVMLKPQLWVPRGGFTGNIQFDSADDRARWMRSYREYILHYARLAELDQIDLLCIGTELEGMTSDDAAWRSLIADVRRVYHGSLTYAANWRLEFAGIRFWDALDYAGLNEYFPLGTAPSTRAEELLPTADDLALKLQAMSRHWHRPILFTEAGYPSVHGAAVEPWIEDSGHAVSLNEQAACYEAIFRAFSGRTWFSGMFWWKWYSDGRGGGENDGSYVPTDKPAANLIHDWYIRQAAETEGTALPDSASKQP